MSDLPNLKLRNNCKEEDFLPALKETFKKSLKMDFSPALFFGMATVEVHKIQE